MWKTVYPLVVVLGGLSLGTCVPACGVDLADGEGTESIIEQLDACDLPDPCGLGTAWEGCADYSDWVYRDADQCVFEFLVGAAPGVIRAAYGAPVCGDVSDGDSITIYRWADGTMTCVVQQLEGDVTALQSCAFADPGPMVACLAAADAGEVVSEGCLNWHEWNLVLESDVEPECGPGND